MTTPAPLPSPVPPEPDEKEPITGSHYIPATQADLKKAEKTIAKETTRIVTTADLKWFLGTVVVIIAGTATTIAWGGSQMDHKVDGGVTPVVARVVKLEERLTKVEVSVQQQAVDTARQTVMTEMLLRERGLVPPPPAPRIVAPDGGP